MSAQLDFGLKLLHQSHMIGLLTDIDFFICNALFSDGISLFGPRVLLGMGNVDVVLSQGKPSLIIFKLIRLPFQDLG